MKRHFRMNVRGALPAVVLLLLAACGGNESVASRSAAAYREAQAKGTPVAGGHQHGGQHAAAPTGATPEMDHAAHGGSEMPSGAHAAMGHGTARSGAATDHATMGHGTTKGQAGHAH